MCTGESAHLSFRQACLKPLAGRTITEIYFQCTPLLGLSLLTISSSFFDRFQQVMHSILACRILLQLRECGKQTVGGDTFRDFGSPFTLHVNTLVFAEAGTASGEDSAYTDVTSIRSPTPLCAEDAC